MSEGPGPKPPQEPRDGAPEEDREVLEGLVIPSRRQPRHASPQDDPRRGYSAPQPPADEQPPAPAPGQAWTPPKTQDAPAPQQPGVGPEIGQAWSVQSAQAQQQEPAANPDTSAPQSPQTAGGLPQRLPADAVQRPQIPRGEGAQQAAQAAQAARVAQQQAPAATPPQQAPQQPATPQPRSAAQNAAQNAPQGAPWNARPPAGQSPAPTPPTPPGGGIPGRTPGATPGGTPDWSALAAEQEESGRRKRKAMMLTGGIVAIAVIAGAVATAVVLSGKSSDTATVSPTGSTGASTGQESLPPEPSFSSVAPPPPANPLDYIGTAAKDKAPLTPNTLFPGKQFLWNGHPYAKSAANTTTSCSSGARSALSQALGANGCRQLIRATYTTGGVAVTVGVAVFDDTAHAAKLRKTAEYLAPLNGNGIADFCHAVACRMTSNSVGRYAYFAIAGLKNGKTITTTDTAALTAANDASNFAFQRIIQRGKDAAAADPARN